MHIIVCVAALAVSPLWAGDPGRSQFGAETVGRKPGAGAGGFASDFFWLGDRDSVPRLANMPALQKDLGLSAEQRDAVKAIIEEVRVFEARMPKDIEQTPAPSLESAKAAKCAEAQKELSRAGERIVRLLTPAQAKRLEQVRLQYAGTEALFRPDVIRALGISPEQQQRLGEIRDQAKADVAAVRGRTTKGAVKQPASGAAPQSEGEIIRRSDRRMLEEVLTAEQQAKLKKLKGAPFAFEPKYSLDMTLGVTSSGNGGGRSGGPLWAGGKAQPQFGGGAGGGKSGVGGGGGSWGYYPLGGRGSVPRLASLAHVRNGLGLSAEQQDGIKAIVERLRESENKIVRATQQAQLQTPGPQIASKWAEADRQLARAREPARLQYFAAITPGTASSIVPYRVFRQDDFDYFPLLVCQVHP